MVVDSNILIYAGDPQFIFVYEFITQNTISVSELSKVEVLGFPRLSEQERHFFEKMFQEMNLHPVTTEIIDGAVRLRQQKKISVPDAIIAATALVHNLPLVTRNVADFDWIKGLVVINPFQNADVQSNTLTKPNETP